MNRTCEFDPTRRYRYTLWREWALPRGLPYGRIGENGFEPLPLKPASAFVQFIGLNPSTADETQDDPTIRRCVAYAKAWGYGAMCMTNLFAYRATDPKEMMAHPQPVGRDNLAWLKAVADEAMLVIAAWGTNGNWMYRANSVLGSIKRPIHCLRVTAGGFPQHPLYLPKKLTPVPYQWGIA